MKVTMSGWGGGFDSLSEHIRKILDDVQRQSFFRSRAPQAWCPAINFYETTTRYVICVELAGMKREDIDVRTERGVLFIQGDRPRPSISEPSAGGRGEELIGVHAMEIDSGRFLRQAPLPSDVIVEEIGAQYRQGYLWIFLPRGTPGTTDTP